MVDIAQQMEERSFPTPMMQVSASLTIALWPVAWHAMYGLGKQFIEEDRRDDYDVQHYHQQYEHKREPRELTRMLTLARVFLRRDSKRFDGIQIVEVGIFKHGRAHFKKVPIPN